jgi:hypothetical protein
METVKNDTHFSLFTGDPGTRKSTAALSYPKPIYFFSFDQKMNSLMLPMRNWGIDPKDVAFDDYPDWSAAQQKLEQFQIKCPYRTLVIDSITTLADNMLRQVRQLRKGQTRKSGAAAGKVIGGIEVGEIEDYNAESAGLTEMIALCKDIHKFHKIDIILIAHLIRVENKSLDNRISISRSIVTAGKKPAAKIPAHCDEAYFFSVEQGVMVGGGGKYQIMTSHTGEDYARTTLTLPQVIDIGSDPLYDKYIKPAIQSQVLQPTVKL